jgi:hypothetical protein
MALDAGDADCTSGLSHEVYEAMTTDTRAGFSSHLSSDQEGAIKALAYSIAAAAVAHLVAHAEVHVTITAGSLGGGLPATDVTVSGTLT